MTVGKSFVAVVLREEAYRIADLRRAIRNRQASSGQKNVVWGVDLTGKQSSDGAVNAILGILDHGTRKVLRLEVVPRLSAWTMLGHLFLAIGRYGKPKAVRTDNASIFTALVFRLGTAMAGIAHQRTEPGCPWMNGRIERFFGTLKQKLNCWQVATAHDLAGSLRDFRFWYNAIRPHQNLNGWTPNEAWHGADPYRNRIRRTEWFNAWDGLLTGLDHRR